MPSNIYALLDQVKDLGKRLRKNETSLENRIVGLENAGFQTKAAEIIKVNGKALAMGEDKSVNIPIPTSVSELRNDALYQKKAEVEAIAQAEIAKSGFIRYKLVPELPDPAEADEHIWYLIYNPDTAHFDIYALFGGEMVWLDDTTIDLSDYYRKSEVDEKLDGVRYTLPAATADTLGGVMVGENITNQNGNISLTKENVVGALGYTPGDADNPESVDWANVTDKPSTYPPSSHNHTKAEITDFPSSMPASDVPAWAKAQTKPSYAWGEITGKPSAFTPASHTHDLSALINALSTGTSTPVDADYYVSQYVGGGTNTTTYHRRPMSALWAYIKGKADSLYQAKGSYAAANHSHSYLPLSGGTMTGDVSFSAIGDTATSKRIYWSGSTDAASIYYQTTAADQGNLVINLMDDSNCYLRIANNGSFKSYFSPADGNFHGNVNGTADTATKLGSSAGSTTQPVYFSGGKPVACSYTLGKSVPSNAVFTDTNTWRGVQNNLTSTATDQSLSAAMGKWLNENKAASSHTHSAGTTGSFSGVQASGSNYVRFTDGTQICWGSISTKTFTVKGTYYNDADGYTNACTATSRNTRPAAEFPQAFANTSYSIALNLSYSVLSDNNTFKGPSGALYGSSYLQTVTSVSPALGKQTTHCVLAVGAWGFYIAVGRWK